MLYTKVKALNPLPIHHSPRTYSRKNCEKECESRIVLKYCNCIMYYMPRIAPDLNICGPVDWKCFEDVKESIDLGKNENFTCTCMPACYGITYDTELTMSKLLDTSYAIREPMLRLISAEERRANIAVLQIFYKENLFRSQNKDELIGFTEFLCKFIYLFGEVTADGYFRFLFFFACYFQPTPADCWVCSWASVCCR